MTKWFLQLLDLTYPITSMFSGREFNKTIRDTIGDVSIEDLWIPFFTLTTDITASCRRIHTNGKFSFHAMVHFAFRFVLFFLNSNNNHFYNFTQTTIIFVSLFVLTRKRKS